MDGDWEEVKKPTKKPKQNNQAAAGSSGPATFGGKKGKNMLVAGAVRQPGGKGMHTSAAAAFEDNNHASNVADYDFLGDSDEEIKFETVSHTCAMSVKNARTAAEMTQA